jgi:hypothetical protein
MDSGLAACAAPRNDDVEDQVLKSPGRKGGTRAQDPWGGAGTFIALFEQL